MVRRHLRPKIAQNPVRHAHVALDQPEQQVVRLSAIVQLADRDDDAFLVNLARVGRCHAAADIGMVRAGHAEADQLLAAESRRRDEDVRRMSGAEPRVVGDQHVAGGERVGRILGQDILHDPLHTE